MSALFTEIFPLREDALPRLYAYIPRFKGDVGRIGGKLAYRLRKSLGGHWQWMFGRIVTNVAPNPVKLLMTVDEIKAAAPKVFGHLELLEEDVRWRATPEAQAEFAIRGPLDALDANIRDALEKVQFPVKNVRVERECKARAWVIGGVPAVSLSIVTRLVYTHSIREFAATLAKPAELVGLSVADQTSTLYGEIIKVVGDLKSQRERLIGLSQRQAMRDLLRDAPDDTLVLRIESKGEQYDYAASALHLLVTYDTVKRFDVIPDQVERALQINPSLRAQMVKVAADIAKAADLLNSAYSQQNAPERFTHSAPNPALMWGSGKVRPYNHDELGVEFARNGAFAALKRPLRLLTMNALGDDGDLFVEAMGRELQRTYKVALQVVKARKLNVVSEQNIDSGVRAIAKEDGDALIAFFPDDPEMGDDLPPNDRYLKMQAVARGVPSLIVHQSTMNKLEATPLLLMGLLARAGAAPFAFEEPLPYADRILGLALHRAAKKDGEHLSTMLRIYNNRGVCLGWRAANAVIAPGDALPESVLNVLLPPNEITMKRTLIHVYGALRPADAAALTRWEEHHDAALYPVDVVPRGNPRLYNFAGSKIEMPQRGSAFLINEREALVVAGGAPYHATPQPLHIRSHAQIQLGQVLDSVMSMALLHHGTLQIPRLPVTLATSEEWADGVERGLFPQDSTGTRLWWL
jgi:hypothetical protein